MINIKQNDALSVLAYSMGGKIALHLLQHMPEKIKQVILIAPDGLHVNFWYFLSTQTFIGNKLFEITMKHPYWFFMFLNFATNTNLLNKSIEKFIHYYLDDKKGRMLLYKRWTAMRKFKPDLSAVKKICTEKIFRCIYCLADLIKLF